MTKPLPVEWCETAGPAMESASAMPVPLLADVVTKAVGKAQSTEQRWRASSLDARLGIVRTFRRTLARESRAIAGGFCGKDRPPAEFLASEIIPLLDACRFLEKNANRLLAPRRHSSWGMPLWLAGTRHEIVREALGVVLVIGPSNYPFFLPGTQVLQAIVGGNAVLLKPGSGGSECATLLARLLSEAGLPEGVFQILPEFTQAAVETISRGVDKVFLTGSGAAGRKVLIQCAYTLTPATVELSGCDAALILPDANLDLAAQAIAFGLTLNSGRTCIAPRRAIVWGEAADHFQTKLLRALQGRPKIFLKEQMNTEFVENVRMAIKQGARLIHGAINEDGVIEGPVILAGVGESTSMALEENWGAVLSIIPVANESEAVRAFHRSPFGLGASIFTSQIKQARALAARLEAGSICINDLVVPTADGRLPFGGRNQSGFGVTRGPEGLLEMTVLKVISTRSRFHFHLRPPEPKQLELLSGYAESAYGGAKGVGRGWRTIMASLRRPKVRQIAKGGSYE